MPICTACHMDVLDILFVPARNICRNCALSHYALHATSRTDGFIAEHTTHSRLDLDINYNCDINDVPNQTTTASLLAEYTRNSLRIVRIILGDLHGNSLTLINVLCQLGILVISPDHYLVIEDIIKNSNINLDQTSPQYIPQLGQPFPIGLTDYEYQTFRHILNTSVINADISVLLLGDIVGDRTSNDALMLAIIGILRNHNVNVSIIFSNHDKNLIDFFQSGQIGGNIRMASPYFSLERFIHFLRNIWNDHAIRQLIADDIRAYLSCIKLFEFDMCPRHDPRTAAQGSMYMFSHAALHPQIALTVLYDFTDTSVHSPQRARSLTDLNSEELISLIRRANPRFNHFINSIGESWITRILLDFTRPDPLDINHLSQTTFESFEDELMSLRHLESFGSPIAYTPSDSSQSPQQGSPQQHLHDRAGYYAVWGRLDAQGNSPSRTSVPMTAPLTQLQGYIRFRNVHGHDAQQRHNDISLDNKVGKGDFSTDGDLLPVLLTLQHQRPAAQQQQPQQLRQEQPQPLAQPQQNINSPSVSSSQQRPAQSRGCLCGYFCLRGCVPWCRCCRHR